MNKTDKVIKCKLCGDINIDTHFEDNDGTMSIPVLLCPTLRDVARYYKKLVGISYYENTGNSIKKSFEKRMISPSHCSIDDSQQVIEAHKTLNKIECWCENN